MYSGYEFNLALFLYQIFWAGYWRLYQQQQDRENLSECIESRIKF